MSIFWRPRGCVLDFQFAERSGSTVYDQSGNGNNGTVYGATWVKGRLLGGLSFDGVDDYVNIADSPSQRGMSELTIHVLWKATAWTPTFYGIVAKWASNVRRHYLLGYPSEGKLWFWVSDGTSTQNVTIPQPSVGVWHTLVGVFKGGNYIKLYVDGVEMASAATTIASISNATGEPLYVGRYATYYGNGAIDEVRIYNRALSDAEIKAHSNYLLKYVSQRPMPKTI